MPESRLRDQSLAFAKSVVLLCRDLKVRGVEQAMTGQLLRSGTSIGANVHEAQYAQGRKDFISKLEIALKECHESEYWLLLLYEIHSISQQEYQSMRESCGAIRRMLIASVRTLKERSE